MEDTIRAYMAGIIDGEGSISLTKQQGSTSYVLRLSVTTTTKSLVEWLYDNWGGYFYEVDYFVEKGNRLQYHWMVDCGKAVDVLLAIKDFLIIKKEQADLAIEFQNGKGISGKHITPERRLYESQVGIKMHFLNHPNQPH